MAVPEAQNEIDTVLGGRYRLEAPIGQGGTATVYRAHDESLGRTVAVKLYQAGISDAGRQEGELTVLASLDHHSLVNLIDAGVEHGADGRLRRYLVMTLVNGSDLRSRLTEGRITARHVGEIGYDMAEALHYIHSKNVIHRDLKPSNILLVDYGPDAPRARAKLTDFGIALAEDIERMTVEGATTGTAAYLSPEQAAGAPVGPPTDIYSLGLVLLECFTRAVEFPGKVVESAMARLTRDPVIPDYLPEHWRELLSAMLSRDPKARPAGAELVSLLRQVTIAESGRHRHTDGDTFYGSESATDGDSSRILDTLPNEALDRVTAMAARMFSAPVSIVSVVDHDRIWLKSYFGSEVEQIAREVDLSKPTPPQEEPVVIPDTLLDPRASESPLVTGPFGLRFYVGVPLKRQNGDVIGTLSVLDIVPGIASEAQIANLQDLAALVVAQLELRQEGMRNTGNFTRDDASESSGQSWELPTVSEKMGA
jgi:serine/threonine protein kinase